MKIPPQNGGSKRPFLERKFRLRRFRTAAARKRGGILGKLKYLVLGRLGGLRPRQVLYVTAHHQWPVYQLHIIRFGIKITFALQRVNGERK